MAQRTKSQFKALYGTSGTLFPDNTTGDISEADVRAFGEDQADTFLSLSDDLLDEDDMASNSATKTATQQSIKAYVDAEVAGAGGGAVDSVNGQTGVVVLGAGDIANTPAGGISATTVQAAVNELDTEKAPLASPTFTGTPVVPGYSPLLTSASTSTAGGTITLDMSSLQQKMFVGSASFSAPKTIAMSNATNALLFNLFINVTDIAAVITVPADWFMSDIQFDGSAWTPPETGKFELGGSFDGTNWWVKVQGPFS